MSARPDSPSWKLVAQGDRCLLLEFGGSISVDTGRRCSVAAHALRAAALPGITDVVPAFNSVALHWQPPFAPQAIDRIHDIVSRALAGQAVHEDGRVIDIPVCYGGQYGPDLEGVARHCGLTEQEVVRLHSAQPAYVFMLGFAPGAPYIGVHDEKLAIGRRDTPRTALPAGSVAIANRQTMIYPNVSPGGWHIIGATPAVLFDARNDPPALLAPGDSVRFVPIDPDEYLRLQQDRS